jgi:Flp pilus assembly protein CpaB
MRGGRIFIIIGVFLGLITMVAALIILGTNPGAPPVLPTPSAPKTTKVVVAVQNIGEGTKVVPQAVELREQEINEVPPGALVYVSQALDKIARTTVNQGQIVQESMLTTEEEIIASGRNASILIPKGRVAIALPLDKLSSVGYALEHGDAVDVLLTMRFIDVDEQSQTELPLVLSGTNCPGCVPTNPQISRMTTQLLVQDAEVLKVGIWTPASGPVQPTPQPGQSREATTPTPVPPPDIVTLMVNQQDALVIKYARETGARYDLVLRSSGDHDLVTTEPVTLDYMLARFGIVVPPKRPYTLYSFTAAGKTEASAATSGGGQ